MVTIIALLIALVFVASSSRHNDFEEDVIERQNEIKNNKNKQKETAKNLVNPWYIWYNKGIGK